MRRASAGVAADPFSFPEHACQHETTTATDRLSLRASLMCVCTPPPSLSLSLPGTHLLISCSRALLSPLVSSRRRCFPRICCHTHTICDGDCRQSHQEESSHCSNASVAPKNPAFVARTLPACFLPALVPLPVSLLSLTNSHHDRVCACNRSILCSHSQSALHLMSDEREREEKEQCARGRES